MSVDLIKKTADYVQHQLRNEPTGHDWFHAWRVLQMSKKIQAKEGGDLEIISFVALLHDLGDSHQREYDEDKGYFMLHGMMDILEIEESKQDIILKAVDEIQFRGAETKTPTTLEAKIVQDADWLDAMGAIGIARVFATGGRVKRVIHDPNRKPRRNMSKADYNSKKQEGTSFNYFQEKVFKIAKLLNTETAKKIGAGRMSFLENYMEEFKSEWEGEK